jgi:hypothetical protein
VAWCEATLGIVPGPGGRHALMGTHNHIFAIGSRAFPRVYFEIIAIDPEAPWGPTTPKQRRTRWFDLDDAVLQAELAHGPRLVHWVARTAALDAAVAALTGQGVDSGRVLEAWRAAPAGELRWRFAVRDDGSRLFGGALPMLIEWGVAHPTDVLPASGVTLAALTLGCADAIGLRHALGALGLAATVTDGPALRATLDTPRGRVTVSSPS